MDTQKINEVLTRLDREISSLRSMVETARGCETSSRGTKWSTFEREMVADKVVDTVADCAMKCDRTRLSIKWEMYRQLREQLIRR